MPWVLAALATGGYKELGAVNVLARPILPADANVRHSEVQIAPDEDSWIRACAQGFRQKDNIEPTDLEIGFAAARCDGALRLQVCTDEGIAGTAAFAAYARVGMFFADSTRLQFAGRGVQSSLIRARLAHARRIGCDLATAQVTPGSASQRNYLRNGFQVLYTRVTMQTPN
jgi:GNAT superfamily N-acetyltransferase